MAEVLQLEWEPLTFDLEPEVAAELIAFGPYSYYTYWDGDRWVTEEIKDDG